jgi:hypothetical protein
MNDRCLYCGRELPDGMIKDGLCKRCHEIFYGSGDVPEPLPDDIEEEEEDDDE